MIVLRNKNYSRKQVTHDTMPPKDEWFDENGRFVKSKSGKIKVKYQLLKNSLNQDRASVKKLDSEYASKIKRIENNLKEGKYLYENEKKSDDTHVLGATSKDRSVHHMSKNIGSNNRLNYKIYKPKEPKKEGDPCEVKVITTNFKGHEPGTDPEYMNAKDKKEWFRKRDERNKIQKARNAENADGKA